MAKQFTEDDDALLAELGVEVEANKVAARTPQEERVIAGFEEIQRFVEEHGHLPQHGEDKDIFERLYAVRLDRLRLSRYWNRLIRTGYLKGVSLSQQQSMMILTMMLFLPSSVSKPSHQRSPNSAMSGLARKRKLPKKSPIGRSVRTLISLSHFSIPCKSSSIPVREKPKNFAKTLAL